MNYLQRLYYQGAVPPQTSFSNICAGCIDSYRVLSERHPWRGAVAERVAAFAMPLFAAGDMVSYCCELYLSDGRKMVQMLNTPSQPLFFLSSIILVLPAMVSPMDYYPSTERGDIFFSVKNLYENGKEEEAFDLFSKMLFLGRDNVSQMPDDRRQRIVHALTAISYGLRLRCTFANQVYLTGRYLAEKCLEAELQAWAVDAQVSGDKETVCKLIIEAFNNNAESLSLKYLGVNRLPESLIFLTSLVRVDVSCNPLKALPDGLHLLPHLTDLLYPAEIERLDKKMLYLRLKNGDADEIELLNYICSLPAAICLEDCETVDEVLMLALNVILPSHSRTYMPAHQLERSVNYLVSEKLMESLNEWLNDEAVTGDKLSAFNLIVEAFNSRSERLSLRDLNLSQLPSGLRYLFFLKELDLRNNSLEFLPQEISLLRKLKKLEIT